MSCNTAVRSLRSSAPVLGACIALVACAAPATDESPATDEIQSSEIAAQRGCMPHYAGQGWQNGFIPQQNGVFQARFEVWGGFDGPLDAVMGLSNGVADSFTDLGPIIRLNPDGRVDVRNGNTYMADEDFTYDPALPVHVTMNVDIANHVYDVDVYKNWQQALVTPLARGYSFRTEQSAVSRLDNFARIVDSPVGSLSVCGFNTSSADDCLIRSAGGGWANRAFPAQSSHFRAAFLAYVSDTSVDAVIGLSKGAATGFSKLATILRFNAQGNLDARDGNVYRADEVVPYQAWRVFRVIMDVDFVNHTYTIRLGYAGEDETPITLALNYRFRTEQAALGSLDRLGEFVDSSFGTVHACFLTLDY